MTGKYGFYCDALIWPILSISWVHIIEYGSYDHRTVLNTELVDPIRQTVQRIPWTEKGKHKRAIQFKNQTQEIIGSSSERWQHIVTRTNYVKGEETKKIADFKLVFPTARPYSRSGKYNKDGTARIIAYGDHYRRHSHLKLVSLEAQTFTDIDISNTFKLIAYNGHYVCVARFDPTTTTNIMQKLEIYDLSDTSIPKASIDLPDNLARYTVVSASIDPNSNQLAVSVTMRKAGSNTSYPWLCLWDIEANKKISSRFCEELRKMNNILVQYNRFICYSEQGIIHFIDPITLESNSSFLMPYFCGWSANMSWVDPQRLVIKVYDRMVLFDFGMASRQKSEINIVVVQADVKRGVPGQVLEQKSKPLSLFDTFYKLRDDINPKNVACRRFAQVGNKKFYCIITQSARATYGRWNKKDKTVPKKKNTSIAGIVPLHSLGQERYFFPAPIVMGSDPKAVPRYGSDLYATKNMECEGPSIIFCTEQNINGEWDYSQCTKDEVFALQDAQKVPNIGPEHLKSK
eukprot:CAMPEP_0168527350 /NCGR_PEP_ID=MMETSP0405-20121227/12551_1 /TAXON_ID=498012 /ORGANISM="Trichosphaerium sp, Strain Am-I-7 wt" /LENGTH=515 /DNA_ID=CAMNT_0008550447 /DNA_START=256 /DNA_END=1803 /DNA_ORIENTATION=-